MSEEKKVFDVVIDNTSEEIKKLKVPPWCPICGSMMKGRSTNTYYDFGCCVWCYIYFIEHREERWKSGWRPSQGDILRMHDNLGPQEE